MVDRDKHDELLGRFDRASSAAGAIASYTFTGRSISWVGLTSRTRGKAQIYVNGALTATVDLWSSTLRTKHLIWQTTFATSATRTIMIKVLGTPGRPRIDVDGFIVEDAEPSPARATLRIRSDEGRDHDLGRTARRGRAWPGC